MENESTIYNTHRDLDVWKKAIEFVTLIYKTSATFPKEEMSGLTNQMRRAAVSIPSNIAEGAARKTNKEFIQFLYVALGTTMEIETQLIISYKLGFIGKNMFNQLDNERDDIGRMLIEIIKEPNKIEGT